MRILFNWCMLIGALTVACLTLGPLLGLAAVVFGIVLLANA